MSHVDAKTQERWGGWGDPAKAVDLSTTVAALIKTALGVGSPPPAVTDRTPGGSRKRSPAPGPLEPSTLDVAELAAITQVQTDDEARTWHGSGKSTPDLMRQRAGEAVAVPDAVVCPASHDEVLAILRVCSDRRIACIPYGGGTSVVGGLNPQADGFAGVVALDLKRLNRLVAIDPVSRTATLEAGLRAPEAERLLAEHGFTLGHFPQSFEYASIGGFAATRSSGQASAGFGRFDSMVVGLTVATPSGTVEAGRAPSSAAGPDLRQLFLGSEGAFGVITSVTVRIRPIAEIRYASRRFESFTDGLAAMRQMAQDGPLPTVLRLSDEMESTLQHSADGCLMIVGGDVEGDAIGDKWLHGRYEGPYLRDALLDAGAFVETLETATFWSGLPTLYEAVRTTIMESFQEPVFVLCHVSHVYETGASLYFTVVSGAITIEKWAAVKALVNDAILANGGTITHHHGVGTDHRDWYVREIGPLGVAALRAVKSTLDPAGIMNPGVLLPC